MFVYLDVLMIYNKGFGIAQLIAMTWFPLVVKC